MRPSATEAIRAVQLALVEIIAQELTSAFAQDSAQTLQLLLESLAGEWDGAAERLRRDNGTLAGLISASRDALIGPSRGNGKLAAIVTEIDRGQREDVDESLLLSRLASRNNALLATLEHILVAFEDRTGESGYEEIDDVRRQIYAHLKSVAASGWSFWDMSSFRERMAAAHSAHAAEGDAHELVE